MNADRLLALYDRVCEAPDAVTRLRRFVLDLAVRGKLVEQDPADEPASELLTRIAVEKAQLVKTKKIKKPRSVPKLDSEHIPFRIPRVWSWTQIGAIGVINPRNEAPEEQEASFVPMSMIAAEYGVPHGHEVRQWGKIKIGYTHFAEGDVGLAKITPCFENAKSTVFRNLVGRVGAGTTELHVVRPILINADYILLFLKSPQFIETGIPKMTGTAGQKRVPKDYFTNSPFPLPPVAEQRRIVAKVQELMALLDQLETVRTDREDTRDRLTAASLIRLTATNTGAKTFCQYARFAFDNLPALSTRPDQINPIRETILNLAVRGKLVEQDPKDEPASELLKRIASERGAQSQSRQSRRAGSNSATDLDISIPNSWAWAKIGDISLRLHYGYTASASKTEKEVRMLRITDIQDDRVDWSEVPGCEIDAKTFPKFALEPGDLLIARTGGTIGKTFLATEIPVKSVFASYLIRVQPSRFLDARYIKLFCGSDVYWDQLREGSRGGGQPNVNGKILSKMAIPIPPQSEQKRIVAKVDELLALCEEIEKQLEARETRCGQLLESLLHATLRRSDENSKAA